MRRGPRGRVQPEKAGGRGPAKEGDSDRNTGTATLRVAATQLRTGRAYRAETGHGRVTSGERQPE